MTTVTVDLHALLSVDPQMLPGIPEFADVLVTDHLKRDEDPEVYDATKEAVSALMREMNNCSDEPPLTLDYYNNWVIAYSEGYGAARAKYENGSGQPSQAIRGNGHQDMLPADPATV